MLILAVDPSEINTGLVLVSEGAVGEVVLTAVTLPIRDTLRWLTDAAKPKLVLLERPATGRGADPATIGAWKAIFWRLQELFPDAEIHEISPGTWKPLARARKPALPDALHTRHEKDAWSMIWYWRTIH